MKRKGELEQGRMAGMTRRERRRLEKAQRKARRIAYCTKKQRKSEESAEDLDQQRAAPIGVSSKSPPIAKKKANKWKKRERQQKQRREQQEALIEVEDREIRAFAKKLGLNKRTKKDTVPKSFAEAGLDDILGFCFKAGTPREDDDDEDYNDDAVQSDAFEEEDQMDSDSMESSPTPTCPSKTNTGLGKRKEAASLVDTPEQIGVKRVRFADLPEENEEGGEEDDDGIEGSDSGSGEDDDELREDIYGRFRDKKGNVVKPNASSSKLLSTTDSTAENTRLVRTLKGSLNRLSESNARQVATQINQLLLSYSRNDVKVVLTQSIFGFCVVRDAAPERLVMEYCLLLALIHSTVAVELSAYFIERLAKQLHDLSVSTDQTATSNSAISDKRLNNICRIFVFCYHLKVITSALIIQLVHDLISRFKEIDIELLLGILQGCGFLLRKDNPAEMKTILSMVHQKINSPECAHLKNDSRTKFMLDTLSAIKNNNDTKVTNYDPTLSEHFRKVLRASVKVLEPPLAMTLHDLYNADEKGRWWIVGSAVTSQLIDEKKAQSGIQAKPAASVWKTDFSSELMELARKQRMNTDLRRTIFCVIMSAEDYLDAFEKLLKLDLRGQQEREMVYVCITCCVNEHGYNPYYGLLVRQMCQYHKRFQLTTQFAMWDKFKLLDQFKPWQYANLSRLLSQLVTCKAMPLSTLKIFEFGELDVVSIKFLRAFFEDFLSTCAVAELEDIFKRVSSKPQLGVFFDGVLVFLQHYLMGRTTKLSPEQRAMLSQRVDVIEKLRFG